LRTGSSVVPLMALRSFVGAGLFLEVEEAVGVGVFVDAVEGGFVALVEDAGDGFVGDEHEFLDELVGFVVDFFFDASGGAVFVEDDGDFWEV